MKNREHFGGRMAVIMALAGSAIGLGNIWRFPYLVGQDGGAAFVIIYVVATLVISLPIFFAESVIGRRSGANCRGAIRKLSPGSQWKWLGFLMVFTPLWIVSYYSVVGGWSLEYLVQALRLDFIHQTPDAVSGSFGRFISRTWTPLAFHLAFLAVTVAIVALGVKSGIEKFSKICLPVLFVLVVLIAGYSVSLPGAQKGLTYMFKPEFSKVTIHTCLDAVGQSFYSLSLGMGIIITYSSYVSKKENLLVSGLGTAVSDLLFALLAGVAIMPAVFAAGIEPASGPGLIFDTLPYIFAQMGLEMPWLSSAAAILFFLTILFAALTSSVSLIEVGVAYLTEERGMKRGWACVLLFFLTGAVGAVCSLSFGPLADIRIFGLGLFDFADTFASNVLLTLGGLLVVLFVGWKMSRDDVRDEFTNGGTKVWNARLFDFFWFLIRFVAPIGVAVLFISNLL
ncbi:MAG: sodium-dependent transporter [Bacteroidales bacterium]|nr:sodium-dependent transporter [Bacteroidales bacterium]